MCIYIEPEALQSCLVSSRDREAPALLSDDSTLEFIERSENLSTALVLELLPVEISRRREARQATDSTSGSTDKRLLLFHL